MSTETKHTPGPYTCDGGTAIAIIADVAGHGPTRIGRAEVVGNRISDKECEANAALFAAAPDLLAACQRAKREVSQYLGLSGATRDEHAGFWELCEALEATIKKAHGA